MFSSQGVFMTQRRRVRQKITSGCVVIQLQLPRSRGQCSKRSPRIQFVNLSSDTSLENKTRKVCNASSKAICSFKSVGAQNLAAIARSAAFIFPGKWSGRHSMNASSRVCCHGNSRASSNNAASMGSWSTKRVYLRSQPTECPLWYTNTSTPFRLARGLGEARLESAK
jgi:hypothetical protein